MTWDERVDAVAAHGRGLTDRQAAFLVTVMLHAGVCLGRHYCTFAGIAYGRKFHDFFRLLLDRGYASAQPCRHNLARLYHREGGRAFLRALPSWRIAARVRPSSLRHWARRSSRPR
jgi:hypothetical protein